MLNWFIYQSLFAKSTQLNALIGCTEGSISHLKSATFSKTLYSRVICGSKHCMQTIKHITENRTNNAAHELKS